MTFRECHNHRISQKEIKQNKIKRKEKKTSENHKNPPPTKSTKIRGVKKLFHDLHLMQVILLGKCSD